MEDKKYSKLRAAFEATQPPVPDDFTERVMKRIAEQSPVHRTNHRRLWWAAAAACLLFIIGLGVLTLRDVVSTSTPVAADQRDVFPTSTPVVADQRDAVPTSTLVTADQQDAVPTSILVVADQRDAVPTSKLRPQTGEKKARTRNSLPDTLGNGIWQRRENVETALRILSECEADIGRSEQQMRNHIIEATFRATPQPANVILVSDENGDYEVQETKRIINI